MALISGKLGPPSTRIIYHILDHKSGRMMSLGPRGLQVNSDDPLIQLSIPRIEDETFWEFYMAACAACGHNFDILDDFIWPHVCHQIKALCHAPLAQSVVSFQLYGNPVQLSEERSDPAPEAPQKPVKILQPCVWIPTQYPEEWEKACGFYAVRFPNWRKLSHNGFDSGVMQLAANHLMHKKNVVW